MLVCFIFLNHGRNWLDLCLWISAYNLKISALWELLKKKKKFKEYLFSEIHFFNKIISSSFLGSHPFFLISFYWNIVDLWKLILYLDYPKVIHDLLIPHLPTDAEKLNIYLPRLPCSYAQSWPISGKWSISRVTGVPSGTFSKGGRFSCHAPQPFDFSPFFLSEMWRQHVEVWWAPDKHDNKTYKEWKKRRNPSPRYHHRATSSAMGCPPQTFYYGR